MNGIDHQVLYHLFKSDSVSEDGGGGFRIKHHNDLRSIGDGRQGTQGTSNNRFQIDTTSIQRKSAHLTFGNCKKTLSEHN
jgi:hypothetical protein